MPASPVARLRPVSDLALMPQSALTALSSASFGTMTHLSASLADRSSNRLWQ